MPGNRSSSSEDDMKRSIIAAIAKLYRYDRELLHADVNERSITHKLAEYLQLEFPGWNVDCEYNRRGFEPKRLQIDSWGARPDDIEARTVFPDIIIHHRLTDQNLAVIEVKKATGEAETRDVWKLERFTDTQEYRYEFGLLLKIATAANSELILYKHGREHARWTGDLQHALQELGRGE